MDLSASGKKHARGLLGRLSALSKFLTVWHKPLEWVWPFKYSNVDVVGFLDRWGFGTAALIGEI